MKKVLKKNLWNRIFHKKQLQRQSQEMERLKQIIRDAEFFLNVLRDCTDLRQLLQIHKDMWRSGIRNRNIGPCDYGMFRTKDILDMRPEEVYLGDIYGLWTFSIPTWEQQKENKYGDGAVQWGLSPDITLYEIVFNQYRRLLTSNLEAIREESENSLAGY